MNEREHLSVRLLVAGERACFRRPEFAEDLVSYDVMPPPVATGLVTRALGPRGWRLSGITVLEPIHFAWETIVTKRGIRRVHVLRDVAYILEVAIDRTSSTTQFLADAMSTHLGLVDYPATLSPLAEDKRSLSSFAQSGRIDLGWMIFDIRQNPATFFRATMIDGRIDLADHDRMTTAR